MQIINTISKVIFILLTCFSASYAQTTRNIEQKRANTKVNYGIAQHILKPTNNTTIPNSNKLGKKNISGHLANTDPDMSNNTSNSITITPATPEADMAITAISITPTSRCSEFVYTISVQNNGPSSLNPDGYAIGIDIPVGIDPNSFTSSHGSIDITTYPGKAYLEIPEVLTSGQEENNIIIQTVVLPNAPDIIESSNVNVMPLGTIYDYNPNPTQSGQVVLETPEAYAVANSILEDLGAMTVTIELNQNATCDAIIHYETVESLSGKSATAGVDYTAMTGSVSIPSGSRSVTIDIPITDDDIYEGNEVFDLLLTSDNPDFVTISQDRTTLTITENETAPNAILIEGVNGLSITEGDSGNTNLDYRITFSNPADHDIDISGLLEETTGITAAIGGEDFVVNPLPSATLLAGQTTTNISAQIIGDLKNEEDEIFYFNIPSGTDYTSSTTRVTSTIINNDPLPILSISNTSQLEGTSPASNMLTMNIDMQGSSSKEITVNYTVTDGTATDADDFDVAPTRVVTIPAGATSASFEIALINDDKYELDETFTITISSPTNASLGNATATATILNDDAIPSLAISPTTPSLNEGGTGEQNYIFTIQLIGSSSIPINVYVSTQDETASANEDYVSINNQLVTFELQNGYTVQEKDVIVRVKGDTKFELDETFIVQISNPENATISTSEATGTIINDDTEPSISITDLTIDEGNIANIQNVNVSLSAISFEEITVNWSTIANTASDTDLDYDLASGILTFAPGEQSKNIPINILGDSKFEVDESFSILLSSATNSTIQKDESIITINNDDTKPVISFSPTVQAHEATPAQISINLSNASYQQITVNYSTIDGTARNLADYTGVSSGNVVIPANTTGVYNFDIAIIDDAIDESDETFTAMINYAENADVDDVLNTTSVTIIDNDDPPIINIDYLVETTEGWPASLNVTLNKASERTITIDYSTQAGTALETTDFTKKSGKLTFLPGELSKKITNIITINDVIYEGNESFFVNLINPSNVDLGNATAEITIVDNELPPKVSIADLQFGEGDEGTTTFEFPVTLDRASSSDVKIIYSIIEETATDGIDYIGGTREVIIPIGSKTGILTVDVIGDINQEQDETFIVNISEVEGGEMLDGVAIGTIINDDNSYPVLNVSDISTYEGPGVSAILTFKISRSSPTPVSFRYTIKDGDSTLTNYNALAGKDYTTYQPVGTITFYPGETTITRAITILDDAVAELDEFFVIELTNPNGVDIVKDRIICTITDPDANPSIIVSDNVFNEGDANSSVANIIASLSKSVGYTFFVDYEVISGIDPSASEGADFVKKTGTVEFGPCPFLPDDNKCLIYNQKELTIDVLDDLIDENDEYVQVNITNVYEQGGGSIGIPILKGEGSLLIQDNDEMPSLSFESPTIAINEQNNNGIISVPVKLVLSAPAGRVTTADYTTIDGTAKSRPSGAYRADYQPSMGTVTFEEGESEKIINVIIYSDDLLENNEIFSITFTNLNGASFVNNRCDITINNDDNYPVVSILDNSVYEPATGSLLMPFNIDIVGGTELPIIFNFSTVENTAKSNIDYVNKQEKVTIYPGSSNSKVLVEVLSDTENESDEIFNIHTSDFENALAGTVGIGTIRDVTNSPLVSMTTSKTLLNEGESLDLTFTLDKTTFEDVNISLIYSGTATNPDDITIVEPIVIPAGLLTVTTTLNAVSDLKNETQEYVYVQINEVNGGEAISNGPQMQKITIEDIDPAPKVSLNVDKNIVQEGSTVTYTAQLDNTTYEDVSVRFNGGVSGTATKFRDYNFNGNSVVIPAGQLSGTISIMDAIQEGDVETENETVISELTFISGGEASVSDNYQVTVEIENIDKYPEGSNFTFVIDEDASRNFAYEDFNFVLGPNQSIDYITIKSGILSSLGSFMFNGRPVIPNTIVAVEDISFLSFTPVANANGINYANFSYTVTDNNGNTFNQNYNVQIDVTPVNDNPLAYDQHFDSIEDQELIVIIANIEDIDGDMLTVSHIGTPKYGTIEYVSEQVYKYTPNKDFAGTDGFVYRVSDGTAESNDANIIIDVAAANDKPFVEDVDFIAGEDYNLLMNLSPYAYDNEDDYLEIVIKTNPSNGILLYKGNGFYDYRPNANFNGTDSFTYIAKDAEFESDPGTVTIEVIPINDQPAISDIAFDTYTYTPYYGNFTYFDIDEGDTHTFTIETAPKNGEVRLNQTDGSFVYVSKPEFIGKDEFKVKIVDAGYLESYATAYVTVKYVNKAPSIQDINLITNYETPISVNVLTNAIDPEGDNDGLIAKLNTSEGPENGVATIDDLGNVTYTPNKGFDGYDEFTYSVCDQLGACTDAKIFVQVLENSVDVTIDITTLTDPVYVGEIFEYQITVTNLGNNAAKEIKVKNPLDQRLVYKGNRSPTGVIYEQVAEHAVYWHIETIKPNSSLTATITVAGTDGGTVPITSTVEARQGDSNLDNNYSDTEKIIIGFSVPNVFSPNGDGINDLWEINGIENVKAEVSIVNRSGKVVYSSDNYKNDWGGENVPPGTYFYFLKIISENKADTFEKNGPLKIIK